MIAAYLHASVTEYDDKKKEFGQGQISKFIRE